MLNPFLAVFSRGNAEGLAEYILEIIGIVVADADGDTGDAHIGINQQILRFANAAQNDILHRRKSDIIFEEMGQIIFIDAGIRGNIAETKRFRIMLVNILNNFLGQRRVRVLMQHGMFIDNRLDFGDERSSQRCRNFCGVFALSIVFDDLKEMKYIPK